MLINEVVLQIGDVAGLRDFYTRVLGLNELTEAGDMLTLRAGRSRLSFRQAAILISQVPTFEVRF